ncbi:MAG: DUF6776 family protein [Pseudomonadales bacterium]
MSTAAVDRAYLAALEGLERGAEARIDALTRELVDARLAQSVDAQAAQSLRVTLSGLQDELATLREELTFYKSLMAPETVARGLQIAEFELARTEAPDRFSYRLVLTQADSRPDWLEGKVEIQVQGRRAGPDGAVAEEVLPLTVLAQPDDYPLPFRLRYFQDLSGTVTLPEGFHPRAVLIKASPAGKAAQSLSRSFDWVLQAG